MIVKTAPSKPSAQTQLVLEALAMAASKNDDRWDQVQQSLDLLFAQVSTIATN